MGPTNASSPAVEAAAGIGAGALVDMLVQAQLPSDLSDSIRRSSDRAPPPVELKPATAFLKEEAPFDFGASPR